MTSNNETVYRQLPWAGNIAKTMTSNGKQFTVTREMLTAVARDQSVQLKVAWCCRRNIRAFFKICFCFYQAFLLYNKLLNDWSLGQQWILFPSNLNVSLDFVSGNIEILGKQNSLFPSGPVIKCIMSKRYFRHRPFDVFKTYGKPVISDLTCKRVIWTLCIPDGRRL